MQIGPYTPGPDGDGIYTGDNRDLAAALPDGSIDMIITDPIYEDFSQYGWLADLGARTLKPGGACVAFCGIGYLPHVFSQMEGRGLDFFWLGCASMAGRPRFYGRLQVQTVVAVWYGKGKLKPKRPVADSMILGYERPTRYLQDHGASWDKHPKQLRYYIGAFSDPGDVVLDPFAGMGTMLVVSKGLDRRWLGFEIKPDVADLARGHVVQTQAPLPLAQAEQVGIFEAMAESGLTPDDLGLPF